MDEKQTIDLGQIVPEDQFKQNDVQPVDMEKRAEFLEKLKLDWELSDLQAKLEEADARIWIARLNLIKARSQVLAYQQEQQQKPESAEQKALREEFENQRKDNSANTPA